MALSPSALSSCRTNYRVMDRRLITGATSGFKLAGQQRRSWCDGDGQEGRKDGEAGGGTAPAGGGGDGGRRRINEMDS